MELVAMMLDIVFFSSHRKDFQVEKYCLPLLYLVINSYIVFLASYYNIMHTVFT